MHADSRVDEYIGALPSWQQAICQQVRQLVHDADPEVEETIKRSVRPYFVLHGNICALLGTKDHVNVFIYDPTVADPHGIINQGHGNATARAVQIYRDDQINGPALLTMFRDVIANNRAGGWRRINGTASLPAGPRSGVFAQLWPQLAPWLARAGADVDVAAPLLVVDAVRIRQRGHHPYTPEEMPEVGAVAGATASGSW
jgi:hypothetical protein